MKEIAQLLESAGIAPTPIRILVYRCLDTCDSPLSLSEIETILDSVDKSTISRTLSIFKENHLVHSFSDGSSAMKYELCRTLHNYEEDMHVHFRCEKCEKTYCLNSVRIPEVDIPEGFTAHSSTFVITGICNNCRLSVIPKDMPHKDT